jgi:hypothetical protein
VAVQLALSLDATPPGTYRQRGTSSLQRLFRAHFPELVARYESEFAKQLGMFRLERISKAVERFLACGDYRRGIARIKCTNPDCGQEYFRHYDERQAAGRSSFALFNTRSYCLSFFSYNPRSIHRYCSPLSSILIIIPQSLRITAMRARPVPRFSLSSW